MTWLSWLWIVALAIAISQVVRFVFNARTATALEAEERALPEEHPVRCPKCGNGPEKRAKMKEHKEFGCFSAVFHSPTHRERSIPFKRPEHLAHRCWDCGFEVKTKAGVKSAA